MILNNVSLFFFDMCFAQESKVTHTRGTHGIRMKIGWECMAKWLAKMMMWHWEEMIFKSASRKNLSNCKKRPT